MKGRFALARRTAGALGISLAMLVTAGTGAGAASTVSLTNYTAASMSQTLGLDVTLPSVAGNLAHIREAISFASSLSQWNKTPAAIKGQGIARVIDGNIISTKTTQAAVSKANSGLVRAKDAVLAVDLPSAAAPIVSVGVGKTETTAQSAVSTAKGTGYSSLASIDVSLKNLAQTSEVLAGTVQQLESTVGTAITTVNQQLTNLGLGQVQLTNPDLSHGEILHVGLMEAVTSTGLEGSHRVARAVNTLSDVRLLDSLVRVELIKVEASARLDQFGNAVANGAKAKTTISGIKIGNQTISLGSDGVSINGSVLDLPANLDDQVAQLEQTLANLVVDLAGVKIEALKNTTENKAGHSFAQANSLRITVAPKIAGATLLSVVLQAPVAQAGVDAGSAQVLPRRLSRTGVADTAFLILGPVLLGAAVLVRRFALSR